MAVTLESEPPDGQRPPERPVGAPHGNSRSDRRGEVHGQVARQVPLGNTLAWILAFGIAVAAGALLLGVRHSDPVAGGLSVPWWVLAAGFAIAELLVIHVTFGRQSVSFSLSEIPIALTFCAVSPPVAVGIRLIGAAIGLVTRKVRGLKLVFNLASAALETIAATLMYRLVLDGASPMSQRGWLAIIAASIAVDVVSGVTIFTAMSLVEGHFDRRIVPELALTGVIAATVNACVSIVTLIVLRTDPLAGFALGVIAGLVLLAYRAWTVQERRNTHVQMLYDFTRQLSGQPDFDAVVTHVLREAKKISNADCAEMLLEPTATEPARWFWLDPAGQLVSSTPTSTSTWWAGLGGRGATRWSTSRRELDSRLISGSAEAVGRAARKDGVVAPLLTARRRHGVILVAERIDDVSTFSDDDVKLIEALANAAAVELDNAELVSQLRGEVEAKAYQASHDMLTGLPNRRSFGEQLRRALDESCDVAVLLMDLDRFKEVNDTLGHAAGDAMLQAVALHLSSVVDDSQVLARIGGDEFAILLIGEAARNPHATASSLVEALHVPIQLGRIEMELGASIGIAIAPIHGTDPDLLLQRADVAMYVAKQRQSSIEVYSTDDDVNDVRRLELVVELRKAINERRLWLEYQPKVALATGVVVGVEALVRWTSDRYGPVQPDEFIPLAECTGLIGPLTDYVLSQATGDIAALHAAGWLGGLAVNVSARSLVDDDLPAAVLGHLDAAGLPARYLTIEVTESSIMREPERNIALLHRLRRLGVRLSIDDFGTGYSSLSYLKVLPAQEVKIDRSFVAGCAINADDRAIVDATIRLAHGLGLEVVAEGIETAGVARVLGELGADTAQGYLYSRPIPFALLADHLSLTRV